MADTPHGSNLPEDVIKQLVENQTLELAQRGQELALRERQEEHSYSYSLRLLDAQKEDRKETREKGIEFLKWKWSFSLGALAVVSFLFGWALYLDKEALVIEVVKVVVLVASGGIGGYSWGKSKGRKEAEEKQEEPSPVP